MFLNNDVSYSNSIRNHLLIAVMLGLLITFVIIFLKPFGAGLQQGVFDYQNLYFSGYGFLVAVVYMFSFYVSKAYFGHFKTWKWAEEILFILFFISFTIFIAHFYTELVINKNPSRVNLKLFLNWFQIMFFSFGVIIAIFTLLLRKFFISNEAVTSKVQESTGNHSSVTLTGDLKKEKLTVDYKDILFIKSEDNYVIVSFLNVDGIHEKMMRISLTNMHRQLPRLIKTHRSYLVNPNYMLSLNGNSQSAKLVLKQLKKAIPVSKTHYKQIKNLIH
jgi:hypothetical protein